MYDVSVRSIDIDDRLTNDQRTSTPFTRFETFQMAIMHHPIHFMFGSRVGLSGTADRSLIGAISGWIKFKLSAILKKIQTAISLQHII